MAERYSKIIKAQCSIEGAVDACKSVLSAQKMNVKSSTKSTSSFSIEAAEKTNWLSTSWPAKVDIEGLKKGDDVLITLTLASTLGSISQGRANSSKLEMISDSISVLLS